MHRVEQLLHAGSDALGRRPAPTTGSGPCAAGEGEQVCGLGGIEPQGLRYGIEHGVGDAGRVASFELRQVLHADVGEHGQLAPSQARHAAG